MKKIAFVVVMLLFVAGVSFGGDLVEMTPYADPLVFPGEEITIMGYGVQRYFGNVVQTELAVDNQGALIDILEMKIIFYDNATRLPLFQVEFAEIDLKYGIWIVKSLPYNLEDYSNAVKDRDISTVIDVDAERW